jgi:hypothetical protein
MHVHNDMTNYKRIVNDLIFFLHNSKFCEIRFQGRFAGGGSVDRELVCRAFPVAQRFFMRQPKVVVQKVSCLFPVVKLRLEQNETSFKE